MKKNVMKYSPGRKSSDTIKRAYIKWREEQTPPIPLRCDIESCYFHTNELVWNGEPLHLILDHINGVNGDDNPHNLRFLCPNCNSQQKTHGGGNRGRVTQEQDSFVINRDDGNKEINQFHRESVAVGAHFDAEIIKANEDETT